MSREALTFVRRNSIVILTDFGGALHPSFFHLFVNRLEHISNALLLIKFNSLSIIKK